MTRDAMDLVPNMVLGNVRRFLEPWSLYLASREQLTNITKVALRAHAF